RPAIPHLRICLLLIHRQRLQDVGTQRDEIWYLAGDIKKIRGDSRITNGVGADVQLVDRHVGKVGCAKSGIVPRVSVGRSQDAVAIRKPGRCEFTCVWVALVAGGSRTHDPQPMWVATPRAGLEPGPVPRGILAQQAAVGLLVMDLAAESTVQIDRGRTGGPNAEARAIRP